MKAFTFLLVLILGMGIGIYLSQKQLLPVGVTAFFGKKEEAQQAATTSAPEDQKKTAPVAQEPETPVDVTPVEVYRNDAYKLAFQYPGKDYVADKDFDTSCWIKGSDGMIKNEPIHVAKGTAVPLSFHADPINDTSASGPIFIGGIGPNYDAKCYPFSLVNLVVVKKAAKFSMPKFIELATKAANASASGGATGASAKNSTTTIDGKQVPFIEVVDGSAMVNKSVTYYFEGTDYIYELTFSYSAVALESEQELSQQAAREYMIANNLVQNFSFQ